MKKGENSRRGQKGIGIDRLHLADRGQMHRHIQAHVCVNPGSHRSHTRSVGSSVIQGRYAEVELLYQRSLAIWEKALEPDHPDVATSLQNYAALLRKTGRTAEADRLEARAKAIRAKHAEQNPIQ